MKILFTLLMVLSTVGFSADKTYTTRKQASRHSKGLKRQCEHHKNFLRKTKRVSYMKRDAVIPSKVDLTPFVSPPENQGNCGSCWDFSLTKALRSEYMLAGKDPGALEWNYLLNNCGPGPRQYGCNGGDFDAAESFLKGHGPGLNKDNPYTQSEGKCKGLPVAATAISYHMVGTGQGPSFKDLASAVSARHVLSIDVAAASGDWEYYSGGIYNGCSGGASNIDHMINLVGYDCETSKDANGNCAFDAKGNPKNGDGYLIVQNNWGESWGERGYMRTRYMVKGKRCNAVATDALQFTISEAPAPLPSPTPTPTPTPEPPPKPSCRGFLCGWFCFLPWCR